MTNPTAEAVALTAATMGILSGICFYFFYRYVMAKKRRIDINLSLAQEDTIMDTREFTQQGGTLKGVLIEENGLEVHYLRKLEDGQLQSSVSRIWLNSMQEEEKRVDTGPPQPPPQPPPPPPPPPPVLPTLLPSPPPPPPPPPVIPRKIATKAPPPPVFKRRNTAALPPLLQSGSFGSSMKPPNGRRGKARVDDQSEEQSKGKHEEPKKMKPFHWDKVNTNADHSVVWNEIDDGSFRFDDELIETLFGYDATKRTSTEAKYLSPKSGSSNSTPYAQISILDPRKSQNTAIVLKSLAISRKEIIDALSEGRGLNADILEKLTKISPTEEEASKILQFTGHPTKLSDAESFLYHILKAIPSAFTRINAMLFRSNYDPEILHLKESLQTLELGCKELRAPGIFLKLLEAILKAGNRMNAGTARGNAKGFNLSALKKLSYVKSTDGKTTLLHFVVEQVVRTEGKRCVINKNHRCSFGDQDSDTMMAKEERNKQYLMLGLPILGGLSTDFSNVKKAATIDYESFISMGPNLSGQVNEIRALVTRCGASGSVGFMKEMKEFLEECEDELKVVRDEQKRVMELVKRTTDFYQVGSSKDDLQIFGFVKDFLDMVDQVCVDLTKKVPKKNMKSVGSSSPPVSPSVRTSSMFQNLQLYFKPENSSDSGDDDF